MESFMESTFFNQTTNYCDSSKYNECKQVVDNESLTSKNNPNVITEKLSLEDEETKENDTDSETDPNISPHKVDEGTNKEDNVSGKLTNKDVDYENNTDTDRSSIDTEQLPLKDDEEIGNNTNFETDPNVSLDNDEEETNNKDDISRLLTNNEKGSNNVDNISPILMDNDDDHGDNTNIDNGIMETRKLILLLGMSTVDVEETVKSKGSTNILDEVSTTTACQCVTRNYISINDSRDLALISSIKYYAKSNVYTVLLVNTNPFKDMSSNPTVYDTNRHLNVDCNCRNVVSLLEPMFCVGNQNVQFQKMAVDYCYMPAVSSDLPKYFSV